MIIKDKSSLCFIITINVVFAYIFEKRFQMLKYISISTYRRNEKIKLIFIKKNFIKYVVKSVLHVYGLHLDTFK